MTSRVSFSAQALRDIELVLRHYRQVAGEDVAADFLHRIEPISDLISTSPHMGSLTGRAYNYVRMLSRFPNKLFYRRVSDLELRVSHPTCPPSTAEPMTRTR